MGKKVNIVYYSRTGTTRKVAEKIFSRLVKKTEVSISEIKSKINYPYFLWLFLSFFPDIGAEIDYQPIDGDLVFLCFPKWTINCPPLTRFLQSTELRDKKVVIITTYGGFDEKRYANYYRKKIERMGNEVKGVILIKRSNIIEEEFEYLIDVVEKLIENELE
ncbi:MAG: hypothetical protein N3A64_02155 [Desulfobacterota bacterium]|nr:hypothetical protein [Thermodesulfobacteriota bacterium]